MLWYVIFDEHRTDYNMCLHWWAWLKTNTSYMYVLVLRSLSNPGEIIFCPEIGNRKVLLFQKKNILSNDNLEFSELVWICNGNQFLQCFCHEFAGEEK